MNWTGGKLQRHSKNKTNSLVSKQKQHFARAQTKLQNGPDDPSEFRPSFLDPKASDHDVEASASRIMPKNRQTKLQDYAIMAPTARRLSSLTPRRGDRYRISSIHTNALNISSPLASVPHSRNPPAATERLNQGVATVTDAVEHYESSTSRRGPSNSRVDGFELHFGNKKRKQRSKGSGIQLLEDKRLELLRKPDWMYLQPTRSPKETLHKANRALLSPGPIQNFVLPHGPQARALSVKRRKVDINDSATQDAISRRIRVPSIDEGYFMSGALQNARVGVNEDVVIKIGERALSETTMSRTLVRPQTALSSVESMESMLLDQEAEIPEFYEELEEARAFISVVDDRSMVDSDNGRVTAIDQYPPMSGHGFEWRFNFEEQTEVLPEREDNSEQVVLTVHKPRTIMTDELQPTSLDHSNDRNEAFRLIFRSTSSAMSAQEDVSTQLADHGSVIIAPAFPQAGEGCTHGGETKKNESIIWKQFLSIPDTGTGSSETTSAPDIASGNDDHGLASTKGTIPPVEGATGESPILVNNRDQRMEIAFQQDPTTAVNKSPSVGVVPPTLDYSTRRTKDKPPTKLHDADAAWKAFVFGRSSSPNTAEETPWRPWKAAQAPIPPHSSIPSNEAVHSETSDTSNSSIIPPAPRKSPSTPSSPQQRNPDLSSRHTSVAANAGTAWTGSDADFPLPDQTSLAGATSRAAVDSLTSTYQDALHSSSADPLAWSASTQAKRRMRRERLVFRRPAAYGQRGGEDRGNGDGVEKEVYLGGVGRDGGWRERASGRRGGDEIEEA